MEKKTKTVLLTADRHAGHRSGLTPPAYQYGTDNEYAQKWGAIQKEQWDWYKEVVKQIGPVDVHVDCGDAIDGRGEKSGGTELITTDRNEQCTMAAEGILLIKAQKRIIIRGTPYHVSGGGEDWEDNVAAKVNADKVGGEEWVDCNGLIFNCKHKVGGSQIPHGRHTAVAREKLWADIWAERGQAPKAHVIVRAHVHYFAYCGGPDWMGLTLPALQGLGSKYGARQVSGTVDLGMVLFTVKPSGDYTWQPYIVRLLQQRSTAFVV